MFLFLAYLAICDFESNGFTFHEVDSSTVQVVGCSLTDKEIEIPSLVKNDDVEYSVVSISSDAFKNCAQMEKIILPNSLTDIESRAFQGFTNLVAVNYKDNNGDIIENTLPPGITELKSFVFNQVNFPSFDINKVEVIGSDCFSECMYMKTLNLRSVRILGEKSLSYLQTLTKVELPSTLEEIGRLAFMKSAVVEITGDLTNLKRIDYSFAGCSDLVSLPHFPSIEEVTASSFQDCRSLKTITFGDKLKIIASEAFTGCTSLESLDHSSNDLFISPEAFLGCKSLKSFNFAGVTEILNGAFCECTSLTHIDMSKSTITFLNGQVFEDCGVIESIILPPTITSFDLMPFDGTDVNSITFSGTTGQLVLNDVFKKCDLKLYEVIFAADCNVSLNGAFQECTTLSTVTLPQIPYSLVSTFASCSNLTTVNNFKYCVSVDGAFTQCSNVAELEYAPDLIYIGYRSFAGMSSLKSFEFSDSITEFGQYAFQYCESLTSIAFKNIKVIPPAAFQFCIRLKNVDLTNIEVISSTAFADMQSLVTIEFPPTLQVLKDSCFMRSTLINITGNPTGLTEINGPFQGCKDLVSIPVFTNIEIIGSYSFNDCFGLKSFECGDKLTAIWANAFINCQNLESFVTSSKSFSISGEAFLQCYSLKSFDFTPVTELMNNVFELCTSLEVADFSTSQIVEIPGGLFQDCTSLREVIFPPKLNSAPLLAFDGCPLEKLTFTGTDGTVSFDSSFQGYGTLKSVEFADSCKVSLTSTFADCVNLTTVVLPKETSILINTFENCISLNSVSNFGSVERVMGTFSNCTSLNNLDEATNLVNIGAYSFRDCVNLVELPLTNKVTQIGESAFENCYNLTSVYDLSNVINLGTSAFYYCKSLTKITLPTTPFELSNTFAYCDKLEEVNNFQYCTSVSNAFKGCVALKKLDYAPDLTTIGDNSFMGCELLESFELSDKLTTIGNYAFTNCESFTEVNLKNVETLGMAVYQYCIRIKTVNFGKVKSLSSISFSGIQALTEIEIPSTMVELGTNCFMRTSLVTITGNPESLVMIDSAFPGCKDLKTLPVFSALETIGSTAFQDCFALESFECGDKLKEIWTDAFINCQSLESFKTTSTSYVISSESFLQCYSLKSFNFTPVTDLMNNAFELCTSLEVADFSTSQIVEIPGQTFQDCTSLREVIFPPKLNSAPLSAFDGCPLEKLTFTGTDGTVSFDSSFQGYGTLKSVEFADSCKVSLTSTFADCVNLTTVVLPKETSILINTFENCISLNSVSNFGSVERVMGTFSNCTSLNNLDEATNLANIGPLSFANCAQLTKLTVGDKLTQLGDNAFKGCVSLQTVTLGKAPRTLGEGSFSGCTSLTNVTLLHSAESTVNIESSVFDGCNSLVEFDFVQWNISEIGKNAFQGAPLTEVVTFEGESLKVSSHAFSSSEIRTVDMTGVVTLNLDAASFSDCTGIVCAAVSDFNVEAAKVAFNETIVNGENCPTSDSDDGKGNRTALIVGIVVGVISLIAIVVIVVVILRKRSANRNYEAIEEKPAFHTIDVK